MFSDCEIGFKIYQSTWKTSEPEPRRRAQWWSTQDATPLSPLPSPWGSHSSDTHHSMFQRHLLLEGSARGIALCTVAESEILNRDALVKHARGTFTHI